jgi:mono/diheme cytochrome c family protein
MGNQLAAWLALGTFVLLAGCSSPESGSAGSPGARLDASSRPVMTPAMLERGRGLYKASCAACHGDGGKGDGAAAGIFRPPPTDHTDRAYMETMNDEELAKVIQLGGAVRGKSLMPGNPQIRGEDLEALVAFTRSLSTSATSAQP